MNSFFYVVYIAQYFIHCYAMICLEDGFNCCNALWCHYWVCLTGSRRVCSKPSQAKVLTGGGDLREAQVDVPLSLSHSCV